VVLSLAFTSVLFQFNHAEWVERSRIAREKDDNIPHHFSSQGKPKAGKSGVPGEEGRSLVDA
jgi:hypothetical protein